jgi:hypothetical protein
MPDSARSQFPENLAEPWAARESCQLQASLLECPTPKSNPSTPFRNMEADR